VLVPLQWGHQMLSCFGFLTYPHLMMNKFFIYCHREDEEIILPSFTPLLFKSLLQESHFLVKQDFRNKYEEVPQQLDNF
jgi:hypothetical protein